MCNVSTTFDLMSEGQLSNHYSHVEGDKLKLTVLSRLDYCNSLLMGTPNSVIQPMQKVQNAAARLILRALHIPPTATSLASNF